MGENVRLGNGELYASFNQNGTCVSTATSKGYGIFNCAPFGKNMFAVEGGVSISKMVFSSSLVCLVGSNGKDFSRRHVRLWNTKTNKMVHELSFPSNIIDILINRKRLAVLLFNSCCLYDLESMNNLQNIPLPPSDKQPADMTLFHSPHCFLGLQKNLATGDLMVYDALNLSEIRVIHAHKEELQVISFGKDSAFGNLLVATSSKKGTLVRVFNVHSGEKYFTLRRGIQPATIFSIAFNETSDQIAVSSNRGTVHIFKLQQKEIKDTQGFKLPSVSGDIDTSFTTAKFSSSVGNIKCELSENVLRAISSRGKFYQFAIAAGACTLELETTLDSS